MKVLIKQRSVA